VSGLLPKITRCGLGEAQGFKALRESLRQVEAKSPNVARGSSPQKKTRSFGAVGFIDKAESPAVVVCEQGTHVTLHDVEFEWHPTDSGTARRRPSDARMKRAGDDEPGIATWRMKSKLIPPRSHESSDRPSPASNDFDLLAGINLSADQHFRIHAEF
jgi:hypothetical protein